MKFDTTVSDVIRRTEEVKSFRFGRPPGFEFDPGQWMMITIRSDGIKTKHFTISSSPTEREYLEFTKRITDHEFSLALDKLKPGDWAFLNGPFGDFTFKGDQPKVGMITGGIGITPLRSMIKYCTDRQLKTDIVLLYANRNEESIVFRQELGELQKANPLIKIVHILSQPADSWKGRSGHIGRAVIQEEIPDYNERMFFVCGPPALVTNLVDILGSLHVPEFQVRVEHFPGY